MKKSVKLFVIFVAVYVCVVLITIVLGPRLLYHINKAEFYESTDINNYGNYIGNYNNKFAGEYINSFFPDNLECFEVIHYSYRAKKFDTYGFEAYLELKIKDVDAFNRDVLRIEECSSWKTFEYDPTFKEYSIENVLRLGEPYGADYDHYAIEQAKIRKILYSVESHTIIYVAIGVYDGGGTGTDELNTFFERFGIDPMQYAKNADPSYADPYKVSECWVRNISAA